MKQQRTVLVIGGGAAGMVAAIAAARGGARVTVLERMQRVGKKLLATGNGRCNLTNRNAEPSHYHGSDPQFVQGALSRFGVRETLAFFEQLGVAPRYEEEGKVFPASCQAASVLDVLRYEMERLGVAVLCEKRAGSIERLGKNRWRCVSTDGEAFEADRIVVAAGGKSTPNLGSNGGGYKIAQMLGHALTPLFPALVQINLDSPYAKRLKGLKIDGRAEALGDGESLRAEQGELLFTDYGISGPPILQLSRIVAERSENGRATHLRLNLMPEESFESVVEKIEKRAAASPEKTIEFSFVGLLHKRLIPVVLREANIEDAATRTCATLSRIEAKRIASELIDWRLMCAGTQSWMQSQVTAGGVALGEVDSETLESRLAPGVYFAGEILDIDGDCGGYNLQWAWSSGYVAGENAAL